MADEKDKSTPIAGLVMRDGRRNTFVNCEIGYESGKIGAYIENEADSKFINFKVINSALVHSELDRVERFVEQLPKNERERISRPLALLRDTGSPNFVSTYKEFISSLGDHITVITPLIPYISSWIADQLLK
ncbi:hypothetical protein [Enterobacter soli]|uniref:hypothetical protein n=1 Tax=Enterobacter soli TaxID=885040 RepID=UPI003F87EA50